MISWSITDSNKGKICQEKWGWLFFKEFSAIITKFQVKLYILCPKNDVTFPPKIGKVAIFFKIGSISKKKAVGHPAGRVRY